MNTLHRCKTNPARISRRAIDVIRLGKYVGWLLIVLIFVYSISRGDNYSLAPNPDFPVVWTSNTIEYIGAQDLVNVSTFADSVHDTLIRDEEKELFSSFNMIIDPPQHNYPVDEGLLRFELSTRKETRLAMSINSLELSNHSLSWRESSFDMPALSRISDVTKASDYGNLLQVVNPAAYPWCVSCRINMKFPNGERFMASGILIDSKFVLTAAHCLYMEERGGYVSEISVSPGYLDGDRPFGFAEGISVYAPSAWKSDEDYDFDYGYIELRRPIGALTGWAEPRYANDSYFQRETFSNSGYPSADYYDGQKLFVRYGTYDIVKTNKLVAYRRGYGGLSGAGCYTYSGQGMFVYGVHSYTGKSTGHSYANRITQSKVSLLNNAIASVTPQKYDLIPLSVQTQPQRIEAGARFSEIKYLIHNYSSSSVSGTVAVKVYLSKNDNISDSDILLQSHDVYIDILPKRSTWVSISGHPTLPYSLQSGKYYIGIILDANDSCSTNNDSDGFDAAEIHVDFRSSVSHMGDSLLPEAFLLKQNYPNPFNPSTNLSYSLPQAGHVTLDVYNVLGQRVTTLMNEFKEAGSYTVNWDASNNASGVYLYKLHSGDFVETKKMMLIK